MFSPFRNRKKAAEKAEAERKAEELRIEEERKAAEAAAAKAEEELKKAEEEEKKRKEKCGFWVCCMKGEEMEKPTALDVSPADGITA